MSIQRAASTVSYDVRATDLQIRQTNNLLRLLNASRATIDDFKRLADEPTLAEFFWTLMQLVRTFTAMRRLIRSLSAGTPIITPLGRIRVGGNRRVVIGGGGIGGGVGGGGGINIFDSFGLIGINVDASMNNIPIPIDRIDLSNIENLTLVQLQQIIDEEGPIMEADAKRLLDQRIIHRDRSTGRLGRSTRWISRLPGGTLEAVAPYAFWVEEGQRSFTGHHFLRDATELARARLPAKITARLSLLIRDGRVN